MTESSPLAVNLLYDALAHEYVEHFEVSHRKAYDQLAWEMCAGLWIGGPLTIVDVGCGVGRWTERWLEAGHRVIGIEPSAGMAARASERLQPWLGGAFTLRQARVEDVELEPGSVDAVVAMGSLQYSDFPAEQISRMSTWLRPGGNLAVLVDSLLGLVVELSRRGDTEQAMERLTTRRGVWQVDDLAAPLHLLDADALCSAASAAGLRDVTVSGLLVGASVWGIDELRCRLQDDYEAALETERGFAQQEALADLGKQLLLRGRV